MTGLSLDVLESTGLTPEEAMKRFDVWATGLAPAGELLVFVGFNAPLDWTFVNCYFHRFCGRKPFEFAALDIKAYYMGVTGCGWADTRSNRMVVWTRTRVRIRRAADEVRGAGRRRAATAVPTEGSDEAAKPPSIPCCRRDNCVLVNTELCITI